MGRYGKKLRKERQDRQFREIRREHLAKEQELWKQMDAEDYEAMLETLAQLIEAKDNNPDVFYAAAYAYFMQGDYRRAGEWVNNTLSYDQSHVAARILLARLCILEDRVAEALAVLDVMLEKNMSMLDEDDKEDIRRITEYYGRIRKEMICKDYPNIAEFLEISCDEMPTDLPDAELLEKSSSEKVMKESMHDAIHEALQKVREIEGRHGALQEKINVLCTFAGGYYFAKDFDVAEVFLNAALRIEDSNAVVLKGLALIAAERGDKSRALQYVAKVQPTDFSLMRTLREM